MTIHKSFLSTAMHFVVFCLISWTMLLYHGYKRLTQKQQSRKSNDDQRKMIVITGCDRGFGRLLAQELLSNEQHFDLVVVALTLTKSAADELNQLNNNNNENDSNKKLVAIQCDVTSDDDVKNMKDQVEQLLEAENAVLFGIVNNAGIANPGDFLWFSDLTVFQNVMDVNFFGQLRIANALLPVMIRTGKGGRLINMSSVCGAAASPSNSSYSASKFALEAWSDSIRIELEPFGVSVVKIRPGPVNTQIQSDWRRNMLQNFQQAPEMIREMYGGDAFYEATRQKMKKDYEALPMTDPELVVQALVDVLTVPASQLKAYYWVGSDAQTFWRALGCLPTSVVDTVKLLLHFAPVSPPDKEKQL